MKIFKLFLLIIISLVFSNQVFSEDKILESLEEGGKIIFIRHAYAPGGGDPENFNINDCSTQRNLNDEGITQSKLIGEFFKTKKSIKLRNTENIYKRILTLPLHPDLSEREIKYVCENLIKIIKK